MLSYCGTHTRISERLSLIFSLSLLLAAAFSVPWACGQTAQQPATPALGVSTDAHEVSLDISAHNKKGKPVLDLKPGEIAVTDDGSPVTLDSLRLVTGIQENPHLITLVFDRPAQAAGGRREADPSKLKNERETAAKILKIVPENGYSVSVLSVDGRLRLQQGFTSDRNALAQAISAATEPAKSVTGSTANQSEQQLSAVAQTGADSSGKAVSARDRALAQALFSALVNSGRIAQDQHMRPSLAGLLALAQSQQLIAQRKAVIYFTSLHDKQIDSHAKDDIESIIGTANRAGVSLYIVDLNSLDRNSAQVWEGAQVASTMLQQSGNTAGSNAGSEEMLSNARGMENKGVEPNLNPDNSAMQHLAEGTGGSYITGNSLRKSTEEMVEDMTTYYQASYLPAIKEYDGKFRAVAVRPLRAGLKLRSQTGYLAVPPSDGGGAAPQPFELPLLKILAETPLPNDLPFHAAILRLGELPEGNVNTLAIEAPLSNLEIREDFSTSLYSARLSIVAEIKDKAGTVVAHFSADIPRRGMLKDTDAARLEVISLQRHFVVPPGQYILQAAILDRNSGKAGAQRMAFEIPAAAGAPSLSNMVLVRRTEPFSAESDPSEPLQYGDQKVTPNLSGQLPPDAKNVSVFFIAHSDPHAQQAATVNIQVYGNGKLLGGAPIIARQAAGSEFSTYLTRLSLDHPVDGIYEVKAILSQGEKTAQASTSFMLAGVPSGSVDAAATDAASTAPLEITTRPAGSLVITFPTNPIQPPAPDEIKSILADATQYAMNYRDSLPNFICQQVTNRSVDPDGSRQWKHKDRLTELLTYVNHEEKRTILDLDANGVKKDIGTEDDKGVLSFGEFGNVITGLFQPSSQAGFQWKETGVLGDGTVQVFDYRVARKNSSFNLRIGAQRVVTIGFHGQVFIDSTTHAIRRVTQVVDDVPDKFPIHAASVSTDFDYVMINNHDYLLPVDAQIILRKGRRELDMNEIEFRNFHRFGSNVRILEGPPVEKP
jgi:VWFA-related protein